MSEELYKKYRPRKLESVIGQDGALRSVRSMLEKRKFPHVILLTGPSGCGKTTLGRILKTHLNCGDHDFQEINAADTKGVDTIREIRQNANLSPIAGDSRIWFVDEAAKLTNDAQNAFLKILEDTPKHVYFMLATTDPHKLLKTVLTRCFEIKLQALSPAALDKVIRRVIEKEKLKVSDDIIGEIAEAAEGSARKALVILEQVGGLNGDDEQMAAIQSTTLNKDEAIALARALINPRAVWKDVAAILKNLKDDPEGVRHLVMAYSRSVMLGGGPLASRAYIVIDIFSANFYDSKHAGLAAACWEVVHS